MQVAVKAGGIPGDRIEVSSVRGDFQVIWMGDDPVASGAVLDIEVEIPGLVVALCREDLNEAISIGSRGWWLCSGVPDGDLEESSGDHYDY
ncbi:hypothetical protein DEU38_12951 [Rhodococcus sp. AG1013]|nr:hypothetical protein DEU38_12951 [Rhodococcus sp. AG1013]